MHCGWHVFTSIAAFLLIRSEAKAEDALDSSLVLDGISSGSSLLTEFGGIESPKLKLLGKVAGGLGQITDIQNANRGLKNRLQSREPANRNDFIPYFLPLLALHPAGATSLAVLGGGRVLYGTVKPLIFPDEVEFVDTVNQISNPTNNGAEVYDWGTVSHRIEGGNSNTFANEGPAFQTYDKRYVNDLDRLSTWRMTLMQVNGENSPSDQECYREEFYSDGWFEKFIKSAVSDHSEFATCHVTDQQMATDDKGFFNASCQLTTQGYCPQCADYSVAAPSLGGDSHPTSVYTVTGMIERSSIDKVHTYIQTHTAENSESKTDILATYERCD